MKLIIIIIPLIYTDCFINCSSSDWKGTGNDELYDVLFRPIKMDSNDDVNNYRFSVPAATRTKIKVFSKTPQLHDNKKNIPINENDVVSEDDLILIRKPTTIKPRTTIKPIYSQQPSQTTNSFESSVNDVYPTGKNKNKGNTLNHPGLIRDLIRDIPSGMSRSAHRNYI